VEVVGADAVHLSEVTPNRMQAWVLGTHERATLRSLLAVLSLLALSACGLPVNVPSAADASPSTTLSPSQQRKLEDWKIRAGLYHANRAPGSLHYAMDANIDDRTYAGQCRAARQELRGYTRGLLKAPTQELRKDALRIHRENLRYLRSCENGRAVAWHHATGAYEAATAEANADYARAIGADPSEYNAPKVFD
jgi:predicted small lipoprotein YifL